MSLLTDSHCNAVDYWSDLLDYPPDFQCLSFSAWLAKNDSVDKANMLLELAGSPLNVSQVTAIYAALTGCPDLLTNTSCLYFDENSTFSTSSRSDLIRALLEARSGNVTSDNVTSTDVVAAALCSGGSSCFILPREPLLAAAYVRVLGAYVMAHLAAYAFHKTVVVPENDFLVTRPQSWLAVGDGHTSAGILEHYIDETAASRSNLVTVYNCYDAIYAVSNGHWACKYMHFARVLGWHGLCHCGA